MKENNDNDYLDDFENITENDVGEDIKTPTVKVKRLATAGAVTLIVFATILTLGGAYLINAFGLMNYGDEVSGDEIDSISLDEYDPDNHAHDNPEIGKRYDNLSNIPIYGNTDKITNILILGVDSTDNSMVGRSDAIMILTLNHETKKIKLTSLMRDTMVIIHGRDKNNDGKDDYDKLNHSYAYGGGNPDLLIETIRLNFRIEINDYMAVNFKAFERAVNAFNGIDVELTVAEAQNLGIGSSAKSYHLDGHQALNYSRIRKIDSDFGRTERQRKVITKIIGKAKKLNLIQLDNMVKGVFPNLSTNMTADKLFDFTKYMSYDFGENYVVPAEGDYTNHLYSIGFVFELDNPAESVGKLHDFIYG